MGFELGPRRGIYVDISREAPTDGADIGHLEQLDLMYRSLCAMLYNYVPTSGHPGGSISSGRFLSGILFDSMDYDVSDPDREDADLVSFAAGHKTLGLYAMWALRNEIMRVGCPELLPKNEKLQLRLEDLLGFRRNPLTRTPLFRKFRVKPLDGHPTPATPFLRLSTGASGVGVATSVGLALGAMDYYGGARAARAHRRGRGRHDTRPGRRDHGDGRHGLPEERRSCTWTGTRPRSTPTASAATGRRRASTSSGTRSSSRCCTTGTPILVPDGMDFAQVARGPAAGAVDAERPADRDRLPHPQGLAVRGRGEGLPRRRPRPVRGRVFPGRSALHGADRRPRSRAARPPTSAAGPARRRRSWRSASGRR